MLVPALLALSIVAGQSGDPYDDDYPAPDDEHVQSSPFFMAWGGNAWDANGGFSSGLLGAEAGWSWEAVDLSVAGYGYRDLHLAGKFAPVILGRIGQRLRSYRGLEGTLVLGIGAARTTGWVTWFQFGLGVRIPLGPLLLGGEITWEQNNLIRLVGGLGARF
jgi:hypothetical protein